MPPSCIRVCHMKHFFLLKMGRVGCVLLISFCKGQTAQLFPSSCSKAVKGSLCLTKAVSKNGKNGERGYPTPLFFYQVNGKG